MVVSTESANGKQENVRDGNDALCFKPLEKNLILSDLLAARRRKLVQRARNLLPYLCQRIVTRTRRQDGCQATVGLNNDALGLCIFKELCATVRNKRMIFDL